MRLFHIGNGLAALVSLVAGVAAAQSTEPGPFYGGAGFSLTPRDGADLGSTSALLGFHLTPNFGTEMQLNVGVNTEDAPGLGPAARERLTAALAAYGVGTLPITSHFNLFARVGVGQTRYALYDASEGHQDLTSLDYGLGASYALSGRNALRFDFTRASYDQHGGDANTWGLTLQHRF
jgi:hypothetical protein